MYGKYKYSILLIVDLLVYIHLPYCCKGENAVLIPKVS